MNDDAGFSFPSASIGRHATLSFPTRRSSDLTTRRMVFGVVFQVFGQFPDSARQQRDLEDRKSTRLNSSHVAISYAVFCLKKKKTTITSSTTHASLVFSTISITHSISYIPYPI